MNLRDDFVTDSVKTAVIVVGVGIEYFHKVEDAYQKLQQLGGRCKDIFIMAYIDKMKIKEIAQELDLSENTVKTYLKRAKETLRLTIMIVALFLILHSCIN